MEGIGPPGGWHVILSATTHGREKNVKDRTR